MSDESDCECGEADLPFACKVVVAPADPCEDQRYGVVQIDDVPVGTGRLDER